MANNGLQGLVERLGLLAPEAISIVNVQALLAEAVLSDREVDLFVESRPDRYARHLVHRTKWFDVIVLTWLPGQMTPIHNHAGNLGWVRLVRGRIDPPRQPAHHAHPVTGTGGGKGARHVRMFAASAARFFSRHGWRW